MKVLILVACFTLAIFTGAHSQDGTFFIKKVTDPNIITTLFDSKIIVQGRVIWKPNFYEKFQFNVSYDGRCYTNLDTVMEYTSYGKKHALLIFTTYGFENRNQQYDCHACAPDLSVARFTYEEEKNGWLLDRMEKYLGRHGSWGYMGPRGLQKIGPEEYALQLSGGHTGQGYTVTWTSFHDLESFKSIFTTTTHSDNEGVGDPSDKTYVWDKKVEFVKSRADSPYFDIVTSRTGIGRRDENDYKSPITDVTSTERFVFDGEMGHYSQKN